ncbi:uncharacterized protein LOC143921991 [Arctopsyche grandis]|uniref:uncharacterized protein LOC143921991 n=1 Tax=Arctopsyche grandis TaxID=121162 RepID=UPI00406D6E5C
MTNYVPPHLRVEIIPLEEPKTTLTELCDGIEVTTNTPYGKLETFKSLEIAKNLPYTTPTVIQKYAIPAVLKGHPIQCRAPTGMGKTMCFLIPLIETMKSGSGHRVCIISPTRELCEQIKEEGLKLNPKLSIICLYGGNTYNTRYNPSANIIVAAPGKLLHFLEEKKTIFKQITSFVLDEADKLLEMGFENDIRRIKTFVPLTASKSTVRNLEQTIGSWGFPCVSLHGDKEQHDRQLTLNQFKTGKYPILVATSVAARGIDVKDIILVVNFDFPRDTKEYIHRIGRTGRQGKEGTAITFMENSDLSNSSMISELMEILKESKSEIPQFLGGDASKSSSLNKTWKNGSKKETDKPIGVETKALQNNIKKMTINEEVKMPINEEVSKSKEPKDVFLTEKRDTGDDDAGDWE